MKTHLALFGWVGITIASFAAGRIIAKPENNRPVWPLPQQVSQAQPLPLSNLVLETPSPSRPIKAQPPVNRSAAANRTAPQTMPPLKQLAYAQSPRIGPADALVTIVFVADFECPYCGQVFRTLDRLRKTYPQDVRVLFKNYPLGMHPEAQNAAMAAMAAHRQGKFWPMAELLFDNRDQLGQDKYLQWAEQIGCDRAAFERDLQDLTLTAHIAAEQRSLSEIGVTGTPSCYINGRPLAGAADYADYEAAVLLARRQSEELRARGLSIEELQEQAAAQNHPLGARFVMNVLRPPPVMTPGR